MAHKEGHNVPYIQWKLRNDGEWDTVDSDFWFKDKTVVVFSLPGAFTPTCTSKQLPGFEKNAEKIKSMGIDDIYCCSVNDSFVMNAWFKNQDVKKVKPLGDGEGVFTQGAGFLVSKPAQGFGMRSWRYSMLVDNGEIIKQFVEEGQNNSSDDTDPFEVSDAKTMLDFIKSNAG